LTAEKQSKAEAPMNPIVIYSSRSGNTEKVALEIATALGCKVVKVSKDSNAHTLPLDAYDLVFLGTWVYGGEPSTDLQTYLKTLQFKDSNRVFAMFMTWAGGGISDKLAYQRVQLILKEKSQRLQENYFECLGKTFGFARKGHPNASDFADARKWAKEQLAQAEKSMKNLA
jgi:flavodoxin